MMLEKQVWEAHRCLILLEGSECRCEKKGHLVVGARDRYMGQLTGQSPVIEQTLLSREQSRLGEPGMLQGPVTRQWVLVMVTGPL